VKSKYHGSSNILKRWINKKSVFVSASVVAIAVIAVLIFMRSNSTSDSTDHTTANPLTKVTGNQNSQDMNDPDAEQVAETSNQKHSSGDSNLALTKPWGTFVNIYHAEMDDQMLSTCNTTVGATCEIIFTSGSTSISLPVEKTDKGGAVYWSWKPKDYDFYKGLWSIKVIARLGDQTKTSTDAQSLEIL
jgi:hypothetical protein